MWYLSNSNNNSIDKTCKNILKIQEKVTTLAKHYIQLLKMFNKNLSLIMKKNNRGVNTGPYVTFIFLHYFFYFLTFFFTFWLFFYFFTFFFTLDFFFLLFDFFFYCLTFFFTFDFFLTFWLLFLLFYFFFTF